MLTAFQICLLSVSIGLALGHAPVGQPSDADVTETSSSLSGDSASVNKMIKFSTVTNRILKLTYTTSYSTSGECLNLPNVKCNQQLQDSNNLLSAEPTPVASQAQPSLEPAESIAEPDDGEPSLEFLNQVDRLREEPFFNSSPPNYGNYSAEPTLRQVFVLHRHGDRTPISFQPKDPLQSEPFWTFHGLGQLTNRGKARLYLLGLMMRNRYNSFLGGSVNKNQRTSRSSGSLRCIESAQTFMAGFLRLDLPSGSDARKLVWDKATSNRLAQLWQPVSVQSAPAKIDGMLAEGAECLDLEREYDDTIENFPEMKRLYTEYQYEGKVLTETLGYQMDHFYKWFWAASQLEVERTYFMHKMDPKLLAIYDRVQEAGNRAIVAYQSTFKSRRLRSGLLINDMVTNMIGFRDQYHRSSNLSSLEEPKKLLHYAAHDLTLVVMLGILDSCQKFPFRPDYASNIVLELHEDPSDNEWFVRIFYMSRVPSFPLEVHMDRCEATHAKRRCSLDKFTELMRPYMIESWQTWMRECGNDLTRINPYSPGS